MARQLIATADLIAGEGHYVFDDSKNRYLKAIVSDFLEEHTSEGLHQDSLMTRVIAKTGTYPGLGIQQYIDLPIIFAPLLVLIIWSENDDDAYITIGQMTGPVGTIGSIPFKAVGRDTGAVIRWENGRFQVGTSDSCNANGVTFHYLAVGRSNNVTAGDKASPPSWIADGVACLGGIASTMGNSVEDDLDTKFLVKHTIDTGAHDLTEFAGLARLSVGIYTIAGTNNQEVLLQASHQDMDIKFLWTWGPDYKVVFKGESLALLREYSTTALSSVDYLTLDTGKFFIDGTKMFPANTTIIDINSDTFNGDPLFEDSATPAHTIVNPGHPSAAASVHSTTQSHTGASSMNLSFSAAGISFIRVLASENILANFEVVFELWIPTGSTVSEGDLVHWWDSTGATDTSIRIDVENSSGTHTIKATLKDDDDTVTVLTSTTDLSDSAWHNITLSRISGGLDLQVDSISEDTGTVTGTFTGITALDLGIISKSGVETGIIWYLDDFQVDVQLPFFPTGELWYYSAFGE